MFNGYSESQRKAIAYYRHSAEDKQENSIAIQRDKTEAFAREKGFIIIHEEADEGKSGLLATRPAFERLFKNWIENPDAPEFDYLLVYDVSRWGRFQDQNEAAYFEHLCTKRGKEVVYVDTGLVDKKDRLVVSLQTSIRRYMAAEYSRQLSEKVFFGCIKVSEQGYSAGGSAPFGMTRQLLDVNRNPIQLLGLGEHKRIANERVSFAPMNDETTDIVKNIFRLFVTERKSVQEISDYLNQQNTYSKEVKKWCRKKVIKILTNEVYIGTRIYNKTWGRLKQKLRKNPRRQWIVVPNSFEGIIDKPTFDIAQERMHWLFSREWKKGKYAIKQASRRMKSDILKWLITKKISPFHSNEIMEKLPLIYAVKIENEATNLWCFRITENHRMFDNVLAVSVVKTSSNMVDDFFYFSISDFTTNNFLVLTENTLLYKHSKISADRIEAIVRNLISQLINTRKFYKSKYQAVENCLIRYE